MEFVGLREDVPRLEDAFVCKTTCTECMERELRKIDPFYACDAVCTRCMEDILETM
ncbi:MAG: hypothetical protein HXS47_07335 [Theionarchaea archaeon]|nr:hypothetical protein [Theionarchaea archaeon]